MDQLKIVPAMKNADIEIEPGKLGGDALRALGLTEGLVTNDPTSARDALKVRGSEGELTAWASSGIANLSTDAAAKQAALQPAGGGDGPAQHLHQHGQAADAGRHQAHGAPSAYMTRQDRRLPTGPGAPGRLARHRAALRFRLRRVAKELNASPSPRSSSPGRPGRRCGAARRRGDRQRAGGQSPPADPDATNRQLQVEMGAEEAKLDPTRPLRCFVNGQFVGMQTLADCAKRNGVSAQALDVGLDPSGALAATTVGGAELQPLPGRHPGPGPAAAHPAAGAERPGRFGGRLLASSAGGQVGECLRYGASGWSATSSGGLGLSACVQSLFDGRCVKSGEAVYGRWGSQTLRLVEGKVETSADNKSFRTLVEQNPRDCSIPPI